MSHGSVAVTTAGLSASDYKSSVGVVMFAQRVVAICRGSCLVNRPRDEGLKDPHNAMNEVSCARQRMKKICTAV